MIETNIRVKKADNKGAQSFLSFLYVTIVLALFYPYEFYSAYPLLSSISQQVLQAFFLGSTLFLIAISSKRTLRVPAMALLVVALHFFWMILNSMYKGIPIGPSAFVTPLLALVLVCFINSTCGLASFYAKYNGWILLMTVLGTVCFFLIRAGVLHPFILFIDLSDEEIMYNYGATFTQEGYYYCGFFDEPGTIAQWSVFALVFNKLFVKNDKLELLLIITTLFTFSMGFYIQILVYLFFFYIFGRSKNKLNLFALVLLIAGAVYFMANDTDLYEKTFGRISMAIGDSKTQGLAVDDRENLTLEAVSEFQKNPLFGTTKENPEVGNNLFEPLALYGIVGTVFLYLPFFILLLRAISKRDYELLKCIVVILIGFTHRPFHKNLLSYFIIYSLIAMCYMGDYIAPQNKRTNLI